MAQQTAVEWLLSELQIRLLKIKSEPDGIVRERMINSFLIDAEQAEAMEKERVVNFCFECLRGDNIHTIKSNKELLEYIEQYYNETYDRATDTE